MVVEGKIFELNGTNPKIIEVVIRKKKAERFYPICFIGFSKTMEAIKTLGIEKTDKVRINFTLSSKKWVGKDGVSRYGTSAIIDAIDLIEKNAKGQTEVVFVNEDTGEIIED
jgi:imidazole glycerol phosphate synthase subunit HisF